MNSRPGVSYGPASFRAARALASFQFAFVLAALAATILRGWPSSLAAELREPRLV